MRWSCRTWWTASEFSYEAGRLFERSGIDLLFVYLHTYVASGRWVPGLMHLNVPIVLVTTPGKLDFDNDEYVTGMSLHIGSPCQVPEAVSALQRVGKPAADLIFGQANGPRVKREILEWCRVANALATYRDCVIGYMGHSYEGMLDMNFDPTSITQAFGVYVKMLEMCELVDYVQAASTAEVQAKIEEMHQVFDIREGTHDPVTKPALPEDIEWAARCAVGLDKLVTNNGLSGLAYYYAGLNNVYERVASNLVVGNTLLTLKGISLAGEADMKTCLAMKTTSALGAGGSFAEFNAVDFEHDQVYVGHDGPHDLRITNAPPGHPRPEPLSRQARAWHRGGVQHQDRRHDDGDGRFGRAVQVQVRRCGRAIHAGPPAPHRQHRLPRLLRQGCGGVPAHLVLSGVPHHQSLCVGHIGSTMQKLGKAMRMDVELLTPPGGA